MKEMRMCVSCRSRENKHHLIRITNNNGFAVVDNQKKLDGRAIYVCKNLNCIAKLKKSNAIKRLLNMQTTEQFYIELENLLATNEKQ